MPEDGPVQRHFSVEPKHSQADTGAQQPGLKLRKKEFKSTYPKLNRWAFPGGYRPCRPWCRPKPVEFIGEVVYVAVEGGFHVIISTIETHYRTPLSIIDNPDAAPAIK